ncbi:MAG: DUF624 domain-containing protein [Oscillospiraceae bacterium]|nr:DUF624 domain-containing protein [Oscillospiraceae bacterium]
MGIFSRNFNRPGPGVPKDQPRKKGLKRFGELLIRDFSDLIKLNLIFCAILIPSVLAFLFGAPSVLAFILGVDPIALEVGDSVYIEETLNIVTSVNDDAIILTNPSAPDDKTSLNTDDIIRLVIENPLNNHLRSAAAQYGFSILFLLISLLLAFPIGGAAVAYVYYITKMMRDDPSYVWYEFKRKFKENFVQAAPIGMICTAFVYVQFIMWSQVFYELVAGVYTGGFTWIILALLALLVFFMIMPYVFMHFAYIDLKTWQILKNSMLMTFAYLPRSFMGAFLGGLIWVVLVAQLPNSILALPLVLLFLVSISFLAALSWVWPPFDKFFEVEKTLISKQEEKADASGE